MTTTIVKRFFWSGIFLLVIILTGTTGYYIIGKSDYSFIDCLYMTVITITTIGFREVIDITYNTAGKIFTIVIAIFGFGTFTYVMFNIAAFIVEGEIKETFKRKKMSKVIDKLVSHYIVCGSGRVGSNIIRELRESGKELVVIERHKETINVLSEKYPGIIYVEGNADVDEILIKAGIKRAAGIFASTGDDNQNLVISLSAKYINPSIRVVARCLDNANFHKMTKAGADAVISENYIAAVRMASEMVKPTVVSFLDRMLSDKETNLTVEEVPLNSKYYGKTVGELNINRFENTSLLAVLDGDKRQDSPKSGKSNQKTLRKPSGYSSYTPCANCRTGRRAFYS